MTRLKPEWFLAGLILAVIAVGAGIVLWHRIPTRDQTGNLPQFVAEQFVIAVNKRDLKLASSYWRDGDIQKLKETFGLDFETFCNDTIGCDDFRLTPIARQKGGSYLVQFEGSKEGKLRAFGLYLKVVEGRWRLVR